MSRGDAFFTELLVYFSILCRCSINLNIIHVHTFLINQFVSFISIVMAWRQAYVYGPWESAEMENIQQQFLRNRSVLEINAGTKTSTSYMTYVVYLYGKTFIESYLLSYILLTSWLFMIDGKGYWIRGVSGPSLLLSAWSTDQIQFWFVM